MKILILEDDLWEAERLETKVKKYFDEKCHIIGPIATFQGAVEAVRHWSPNIALIDINLKDNPVGGINLASVLNEFHQIPIIFVTGSKKEQVLHNTSKIDFCDFLCKPWNDEGLKKALSRAEASLAAQNKTGHRTFILPSKRDLFWARKKDGGYESIAYDDIVMVKPAPDHTQEIFIYDQKTLVITGKLKDELFKIYFGFYDNFYLLGQKGTAILNRKYIRKVINDKVVVSIGQDDQILVNIPRGWKDALLKWLGIDGKTPLA